MVAYEDCQGWSSAPISGRSPSRGNYSHPHPHVRAASSQGQSGPQVQLQPQEQPWVLGVVVVIVVISFGCRLSRVIPRDLHIC